MPGQDSDELDLLSKRINQLVENYSKLRLECNNLKTEKEALKVLLLDRETELKELEKQYERVKLTGALLGDGENAAEAKKKINELVREIDNCIALLNR
jgi:hypothetical protein